MRRANPILLAIMALSVLLALIAVVTVWPHFDGLYGQDSFAYYNYSQGPLAAALEQGELPPSFFWPPGFPLLAWLAMRFLGTGPEAGQFVALLAGAAVPLFTSLLAWELFLTPQPLASLSSNGNRALRWTPLLAGLLVVFQAQLWQSSIVVMSDTPALATGTAGVWLAARWGRTGRLPTLCLAAGLLAYALLTRWAYGLVALAVTGFALSRLLPAAGAGLAKEKQGTSAHIRHPLRQVLVAGLVVLLVLLPVWLPAGLDLLGGKRGETVAFAGDLAVYSWSPLNAVRRTFTTTDGHLAYRLPNGLYYALAPAHRYFFTPLLALLLLPGLWQLWRWRTAARLWLIAGWAGLVIAFHAGAPWQNFRFTLVYLPPLAIVVALGITTVLSRLQKLLPGHRQVARLLLAAWVLVGLGTMAWKGVELTRFFVERKQADLATVAWVETETPPDAHILAFNMTFTLAQYGSRETEHLFYQTPETVAALVATGRPLFLLLEVDSFTEQWAGHRAEHAFRWLQQEPGLVAIGQEREYILYRVNQATR